MPTRLPYNRGNFPREESAKRRRRRLKGQSRTTKYKPHTPRLLQTTITGETTITTESEDWGSKFRVARDPDTFRIAFQNISPQTEQANTTKTYSTARAIYEGNYDVFLFAEHGLNLRKIKPGHKWQDRMNQTYHSKPYCITACNIHESTQSGRLWGGTGMVIDSNTTSLKIEQGNDPTGLGRWCWVRLKGKGGQTVKIISAYRPVKNEKDAGSCWRQHIRHLRTDRITGDPRSWFIDDLRVEIDASLHLQDQVIVGIDINDDVRQTNPDSRLHPALQEIITTHHHPQNPPATCRKNSSNTPIDGIYATSGIHCVRAGYMAFDSLTAPPSDHRLIWADIDLHSILGFQPPRIQSAVRTRLTSTDPRIRDKYIKEVKKRYNTEGLFQQARVLKHKLTTYTNNPQEREEIIEIYNNIHSVSTAIRMETEKTIRKIKRGGKMWSPQLQHLRDDIEFWQRAHRYVTGARTSRIALSRLAQKLNYSNWHDKTEDETLEMYKKSLSVYKKESAKAENWRHEYQENLALALAKDNDMDKDIILKRLITTERQRSLGKKARLIRQKGMKEPVKRVEYYDPQTDTMVECLTHDAIVDACAQSNIARQTQTEDTPFMQPPLLDHFGYLADTPYAEEVLNGTYIPPTDTDIYARELLQAMKRPPEIEQAGEISLEITLQDHILGWKRQKEQVASEPNGLSFAHYKCAVHDTALASIDTLLRNTPLQIGFVPERWKQITDVEILKKPGVYNVDKMRLIQLMPADFQACNKLLGKRVMAHAERMGTLDPDQHGSRKHHRANLACLNKVLLSGIIWQCKMAGAFCMNDAKSCYDRINHSVAVLCYRRQGCPKDVCETLFRTLQLASHHIQTGYDTTKNVYNQPPMYPPLQGNGQGNGNGPCSWAVISTVIILAMRNANHGCHLRSAILGTLLYIVCFAFVDDTDTVQTGDTVNETGEELLAKFQTAVDRWEGLIKATGGAIEPTKSFWYLIDTTWDYTRETFRYRTKDEMPGNLSVKDSAGNRRTLDRHEPSHAEKTLGVYVSLNGDQQAEINYLRSVSEEFALQMRGTARTQEEAIYTFKSSLMKTLEYPTVATMITEKEWNHIMEPALKATIQAAGMAGNFPRTIIYGPSLYQGFGIIHPYYFQELTHIKTRIEEGMSQSQTGKLLDHLSELFYLEAGLNGPYRQLPYDVHSTCVSDTWYKTLWNFCNTNDITITEPSMEIPCLRRQDKPIMLLFSRYGYKGDDLRRLNIVRMKLKAFSVADLATPDGRLLTTSAYNAIASNSLRDQYTWPRSPPALSQQLIRLWQSALTRSLLDPAQPPNYLVLRTRLGHWTRQDPLDNWLWRWIPQDERLLKREGNLWRVFTRSQNGRGRRYTRSDTTLPHLPHQTLLASITHRPDSPHVHLNQSAPAHISFDDDPEELPFDDLEETFDELQNSPEYLVDEVTLPPDGAASIAQGIIQGTARAVSDGSFLDSWQAGTSSWIIVASPTDQSPLQGVNWVNGLADIQSAYRSELAGVIGMLTCIWTLCKHFNIHDGRIEIGLDGASALHDSKEDYPLTTDKAHIRCDEQAKAYLRYCCTRQPIRPHSNHHLRFEQWRLYIRGVRQIQATVNQMYDLLLQRKTLGYWQRRHGLPQNSSDIMWKESKTAFFSLTLSHQIWKTKFNSGFLPTHNMEYNRGSRPNKTCPRCPADEHTVHIIRCPSSSANAKWRTGLQSLATEMESQQTHPILAKAIIQALHRWRRNLPLYPQEFPTTLGIRTAVTRQGQMGWENFFLGRWHRKWADVQHRHLRQTGSKRSSRRWTVAIIKKLFQISWDMWDHRNKVKHNPGGQAEREANQEIDTLVLQLHALGPPSVHPQDRHLYNNYPTIQELLAEPMETRMRWTKDIQQAQAQKPVLEALEAAPLQPEQQLMANWLQLHPP